MLRNHALLRPRPCSPRRASCPFLRQPARQFGTSLIEFSIVAVPVLLLSMGSIEASQWFFKRQALSLALLEAGRAAITAHARPSAIEAAFEKALLPLFADQSQHESSQRLHRALAERRLLTDAAAWRIEILSPSPQAFIDFSDPTLAIAQETGLRAINNNYLAEQARRTTARGPAPANGSQSGLNILQANTLVLRLTYLHEPILPGIKGLIRVLGSQGNSYGQNAMARGGYIPVVRTVALVMQSHPVDWPSLANGKVVKEQLSSTGQPVAVAGCKGLWCMNSPETPASGTSPEPSPGTGGPLPQWPPSNPKPPNEQGAGTAPGNPPETETDTGRPPGLEVGPDDPACGVVLCCTA